MTLVSRGRAPLTGLAIVSLALMLIAQAVSAAQISEFIGSYSGSAKVVSADGTTRDRDMSVEISETKDGFNVRWTSITYREDGRTKESSYSISFLPSDRAGVYAAAMKRDVFGHDVQLDPMRGEPYVWARIDGATLSVYSLYVDASGGYELQQFDRTLAEGGLNLDFSTILNGETQRTVTTFLHRQ